MTEELNELGLRVGQRRVGRVRRENSPPDCFLVLLTAPERYPGGRVANVVEIGEQRAPSM